MKTAVRTRGNRAASITVPGDDGDGASRGRGFAPGPEAAVGFHETGYGWIALALVWIASAAYMAARLRMGSLPTDVGELGQMAERVLGGQVPFRDFVEVYSGALTYLNALAFRLFGVTLLSLRIPMFLFFLGWVPAVYFIARRFAPPLAASVATLLAVAWGPPNYAEAMPSLYNLFFATWGVLALFRHMETRRRRWLWIAGLCGGLSLIVKITALYFVAACFLFFVFRELCLAHAGDDSGGRGGIFYPAFASSGLLLFLVALARLTALRPTAAVFFSFTLPSAVLVAVLIARLWQPPLPGRSLTRLRRLLGMVLPFAAGAAIPAALFALWFAREGALREWVHGTLITPLGIVQWAARDPLRPMAAVGLAPILIAVAWPALRNGVRRAAARVILAAGLTGILVWAWRSPFAYHVFGISVVLLLPVMGIAAPLWFSGERLDAGLPAMAGLPVQRAWLVLAAAVVCSIVAFPFSEVGYPTSAVLPLAILAFLALLSLGGRPGGFALGSLAAFYLAFALLLRTPTFMSLQAEPLRAMPLGGIQLVPSTLAPVKGIRLLPKQGREYEQIVSLIRAHARGRYIYAGPDSPDVYFVSGFWNPTPAIWDFRDSDFTDPLGRSERILNAIESHGVTVVVIRTDPPYSGPMPAALEQALDERFPRSRKVDEFEVRWRP